MAESKKTANPVKSKEKSSMLDIDIDKDFMGSWKSMSMGDDGMDFDFGPPTEGKKKAAYKFDKMDMDFNLDADFGKLPSFKMDMTSLDISSPAKKSGKSNEKSKEAASGGEKKLKTDSFQFDFDFDGFGGLDFDSKKSKLDEKSDKSEHKKELFSTSVSESSGDIFSKEIGASKDDDISSKRPTSKGVDFSKVDTQMDNIKDPASINEDDRLKSVIDDSCPPKPANFKEQDIQQTISPEKITSCSLQEPIQEYPELHAHKVNHNVQIHSLSDNISTESTHSEMQEEESRTMVKMVGPSTDDEKNENVDPVIESIPARSLLEHMNSESEKGEMCEVSDDNVVSGKIDGDDKTKDDSHLESHVPPVNVIENLGHEENIDNRNKDSFAQLHPDSQNSGTTMVSEKEKGNIPIRSKYFKKQNEYESELHQSSVTSTKLISVSNKQPSKLTDNPVPEKREFGSKFTGISRSLPKVINRDIHVHTENKETDHAKGAGNENTQECLNANNLKARNEPMVTAVKPDIGQKEKDVPKGSHQNTEHINNALRSDVHPSSSIVLSNKSLSQNTIHSGLQVTNVTSTRNTSKIIVEKKNKTEMKTSEISTLKVSRQATEPKLKPLNSLLLKGLTLTSMKTKEKGPELQPVDTKKQAPSTPSLKRKAFEESAETPRSTPIKRFSASPRNYIRSSPEIEVGKEVCNDTNMANVKSPRVDFSQIEMDISSEIENDGIFEKAEACSKELEDICNMLKKKHEEAKDILVRAIVNNNNLLMLNHPIYQDKIRMVQKFASLLINK